MADNNEPPQPPRSSRLPRTVVIAALGVAIGSAGLLAYQLITAPTEQSPQTATLAGSERSIAEADFQSDAAKDVSGSDVLAEWRAARSDHKIIALAIANCTGFDNADVMPRFVFSALRLDLRPGGDHYINVRASDSKTPAQPPDQAGRKANQVAFNTTSADVTAGGADTKRLTLTGYEQTMLVLSDVAARTRISAADGASSNYPKVNLFGWYTVLISGLATLLITLKSSMNPRPREPDRRPFWTDPVAYRNGVIVLLGIGAIVCSTAGTVLNGVKQFYDPTTAYVRNTTALVKSRQLHQEIALAFINAWNTDNCESSAANADQVKTWSNALADLQQQILKAAVPIPGLDGTTPPKGTPPGDGSSAPRQPADAPRPSAQGAPAAQPTPGPSVAASSGPNRSPATRR
jgi:hypothetical protein